MRLPTVGPDPLTRSQRIRYVFVGALVVGAVIVLIRPPGGSGLPLVAPYVLLFVAALIAVLAYLEPSRPKRFRLVDTLILGVITAYALLGLVPH